MVIFRSTLKPCAKNKHLDTQLTIQIKKQDGAAPSCFFVLHIAGAPCPSSMSFEREFGR